MKHIQSVIVIWPGILLPIIWEKFHENVLILGAGGQIARHVINQLEINKPLNKLYLPVSQQKSTNLSN